MIAILWGFLINLFYQRIVLWGLEGFFWVGGGFFAAVVCSMTVFSQMGTLFSKIIAFA